MTQKIEEEKIKLILKKKYNINKTIFDQKKSKINKFGHQNPGSGSGAVRYSV
jgi:hypothetical protein